MKTIIIIGFIILSVASFSVAILTSLRKRDLKYFGIIIPKEEVDSKEIYIRAYRFETISGIVIAICTACTALCKFLEKNISFIIPVATILLIVYYIGCYRIKKKIVENKNV